MSADEPSNADLLAAIRDLRARIDGLQAEVETGFAETRATLGTLALGQVNLLNVIVAHASDRRAHGGTP